MRLCSRDSDLSEETKQGGFMKKYLTVGTAFTIALGLAACTPPAEGESEAAPEEVVEDGTMTGEASEEEDSAETTGADPDGNPVDQ